MREVALVAHPLSADFTDFLQFYFFILLKAAYLLAGLAIFLLKPNNKQVLLVAMFFATMSMSGSGNLLWYTLELPLLFALWWRIGFAALALTIPILLHLALVFPERSRIVRRFPNLEWLIYLPALFSVVPFIVLTHLSYEGFTQFDNYKSSYLSTATSFVFQFYLFATITILLLNYLRADAAGKRRVRLVMAGFAFSLVPYPLFGMATLIDYLFNTDLVFNINLVGKTIPWLQPIIQSLPLLMPITVAYAILRHKVLPISFVVRRGLQYLLAKNALRLLLVLPILGIIWNIAANPNRTLSEILMQNSANFYLCILLAVAALLLNRFRLNDWIDRRFFREQHNQERVLRELTEAVKESDSLPKLSRFVSSKIQAALHPENVYLFFRDDAQHSDFSLGYATSGGETSANMKLAVDSPLLRFMQMERNSIDFPGRRTDELPNREKRWLQNIRSNLLVPMHGTDGKLAGFFSLGEKKSEIPYTGRDKELLKTLASQIALVHENLNLKDRMRREQKIKTEVLSRFDEGNINLLKECPSCGRCYDRMETLCAADQTELIFTLPVERTIENRYRLEKSIGKGGMGAVYEATDLRINRRIAVKILSAASFGNRDALRRFEREAQTAGRLQHKNVVTVFDYGLLSTEGAFLVMELVRGESLRDFLKRGGKLDLETVGSWFGQILDGVEAAHKAGIVHRDLKPDNIIVAKNEPGETRLCILDFGLARAESFEFAQSGVTVPGTVIGTFGYMSPEQLRGEPTDERSDLFSVAVMVYEALRGEKPFRARSYHDLLREMSDEIVFESDAALAEFFARGLAREPDSRFASASEMKRNLTVAIARLQT